MARCPRLVLAAMAVTYAIAALAPCADFDAALARPPAMDVAAEAHHEAAAPEAPPCHAPETVVKAPCTCGCGDRAAPSTLAKLPPALRPAPLGSAEKAPVGYAEASLPALVAPDLGGPDAIPRSA